jgi:beta-propeller repeat-containing protein/BACON domain-containing protein
MYRLIGITITILFTLFIKSNSAESAPSLVYSTYLGGRIADQVWDMAVDAQGNTYISGYTASDDLPVLNAVQPNYGGQGDAFVAKFDPQGQPIYITYLGGNYLDFGTKIAADANGNAYVTGWTGSTDFPKVNAFQPNFGGTWDGFVSKISADGSTLLYSSYLGGSDTEDIEGIAVDSSGAAYVTGVTQSSDYPVLNAFQPNLNGANDIIVTKISPSGSSLVYSTYLGGDITEIGLGIAVDTAGKVYITGDTQSDGTYPIANAAQPECAETIGFGCWDVVVSVLSADGLSLVYSTYLGGNDIEYVDRAFNITVDSAGTAYVTGMTGSDNFPMLNAYQPFYGGQVDVFVTQYSSSGQMLYSTYFGGTNSDVGYGVSLNSAGDFYVTGLTISDDFPVVDPMQSTLGGFEDPFIIKFLAGGQSVGYATYFGGSNGREEYGAQGIGLDLLGDIYIAGQTEATDFPILNAYQTDNHGSYDGFISKITETSGCNYAISPTSASFDSSGGNGSVAVIAPPNCDWTAVSNDSWITITSGESGTGNGVVEYSVADNSDSQQRIGTMLIATKTFTVIQSGGSSGCLFCDDFADGVLASNWTYIKNISDWSESNDALSGSSIRKTEAHAIPAFGGCNVCYGETVMRSAGGPFNRVWFLFHVQDKNNLVELMMDEGRDRWVLKHRINKTVVAKQKVVSTIDPNTDYLVRIRYDGTNYIVTINGVDQITLSPGGTVNGGSVGFKVKATTGTFQSITVN